MEKKDVIRIIRETTEEEYALADKTSGKFLGNPGIDRAVNEIIRFFAERIIDKIEVANIKKGGVADGSRGNRI